MAELSHDKDDITNVVADDISVNEVSLRSSAEDSAEWRSRTPRWMKNISVEVILFLFNVASMMVYVTTQDLMLDKTCKVNFKFSDEICDELSDNDSEEVVVQTMVSNFSMWRSYLETSIKILTVPLLGWWGDKYGRKSPFIMSLTFLGLESFSYLLNAVFSSWRLEAIMLGSFFYGLSGGTHAVLMLAFSYMADRTSVDKRTVRIGILDGFWYLGSPVGLAIGPPLLNNGGYSAVFGMAVLIYIVAIIYVIAIIKNKRVQESLVTKEPTQCCQSFGIEKLTNAFYVTFEKRPNLSRRLILTLVLAMLFDSFVIWGESSVKYLFTQRALDWTYDQYSHWGTLSTFLTFVGTFIMVPIFTIWHPTHDALIGLIGGISRTLERVAYLCATQPSRGWLMYAGAIFGTCSPLAPIAIRSHISKLAGEDVGQVYAVMAVGESLLPFISSPAYLQTYTATVDWYPGIFYLISIASNLCLCLSFVYVYYLCRKIERRNS